MILTGIQNNDMPHLGNILGVILPTIKMVNKYNDNALIFIADLHSMTQIKNNITSKINTYKIVATFISLGLKNKNNIIVYKQSDIKEITELNWYLSCFFSYKRLKLVHSFKEKQKYLKDINVGLFTYPILMASDILLFNPKYIPIGKDQIQHIEITRKIAKKINNYFNNKIFFLPKMLINQQTMKIIGTNGEKMSKSKGNIINIFAKSKILKKQIMSIKTDNQKIKSIKNIDNNIFNIYKLIANKQKINKMKKKYKTTCYGYKDAKEELYDTIINKFNKERKKFHHLMNNKNILDEILLKGKQKAQKIANKNIKIIRKLFF